jgi:uncharacterized membrane-anchored protein
MPSDAARMDAPTRDTLSKVPQVTLLFWLIKIAATTSGETGGDAGSMFDGSRLSDRHRDLRRAVRMCGASADCRTPIPPGPLLDDDHRVHDARHHARGRRRSFAGHRIHRWHHILLALLATCLWLWHRTLGSIAIGTVSTPKAELFYWVTIMLSQTLGTALGDWTADTAGLGYLGAASILGGAIALVAVACFRMSISPTLLFWAAFVLTRPPGAVLGNFLGEPVSHGGLELSRYAASAVLLAFIAACVALVRQGAAARAIDEFRSGDSLQRRIIRI